LFPDRTEPVQSGFLAKIGLRQLNKRKKKMGKFCEKNINLMFFSQNGLSQLNPIVGTDQTTLPNRLRSGPKLPS